MMRTSLTLVLITGLLAADETPSDLLDAKKPPVELTAKNYTAWRDHILPSDGELAWEQIPWKATFHDGIAAANTAKKPLLLWVMNGHPLGCT